MLKKRKGFTLFEAIISVGIIALSSVTILQVFYVSSNLNKRASDLDTGNSILTQAMEISKNVEDIEDFFNDSFFEGSVDITNSDTPEDPFGLDNGDLGFIKEFGQYISINPLVKNSIVMYYDKNWNVLYGEDGRPDDAKFIAKYDIIEDELFVVDGVVHSFNVPFEDESEIEIESIKGMYYTINASIIIVDDIVTYDYVGEIRHPILTTLSSGNFVGNTRN